MPTVLPRIQVTQTPPVARALEIAAKEWPGVPRSELIARLLERGAEATEAANAEQHVARQKAIITYRGAFADAYPSGYLEELRQDWTE